MISQLQETIEEGDSLFISSLPSFPVSFSSFLVAGDRVEVVFLRGRRIKKRHRRDSSTSFLESRNNLIVTSFAFRSRWPGRIYWGERFMGGRMVVVVVGGNWGKEESFCVFVCIFYFSNLCIPWCPSNAETPFFMYTNAMNIYIFF